MKGVYLVGSERGEGHGNEAIFSWLFCFETIDGACFRRLNSR